MISIRVPGKIMLAGEYAVLAGRPALGATLDRHLIVRARKASPSETSFGTRGDGLMVSSDLWNPNIDHPIGFMINRLGAFAKPLFDRGGGRGKEWGEAFPLPQTTKGSIEFLSQHCPSSHKPLLLAAWEGAQAYEVDRGTIHVISELKVEHGLGSSSALYLGVLGACSALSTHREGTALPKDPAHWALPRLAWKLQSAVQKRASGYDIATQFLGGLVEFRAFEHDPRDTPMFPDSAVGNQALRPWPHSAIRHSEVSPQRLAEFAHIFVGGFGAPTGPLVRSTVEWIQERGILAELCSRDAKVQTSLKKLLAEPMATNECKEFFPAVKEHRELMSQMPQYPQKLAQALMKTPGCDQTWTFKTTGAGGEDALLLWGELQYLIEPTRVLKTLGWKRLEAGFERFGMQLQVTHQKIRAREAIL